MTDDAFTERQRAHAQMFQAQLQALYTQQTEAEQPSAAALNARLVAMLDFLEQMRLDLPDPVSQGKVLAALHILRSVAAGIRLDCRR